MIFFILLQFYLSHFLFLLQDNRRFGRPLQKIVRVCVCAYLLFGVCRRLSNKLKKNERRKEHKTNKGNN